MKSTKKWFIVGIAAVLLLSIPLVTNSLQKATHPESAYATANPTIEKQHVITVDGRGEILATPDVAYISLGIQTTATTANEAQKENAAAFAKLNKVLYDQFQLDKKDVKTSSFNVRPIYSYENKVQQIKGYTATQMLEITFRDMQHIGTLLDAASGAGANQINNVQFGTEKSQEYELQAIQKAMANADAKAKTIAKSAHVSLKQIINVNQSSSVPGPIPYSGSYKMLESSSAASTSISTGQLTITTTVQVQYSF